MGGVESHIYQLSQCLIERGHKVNIGLPFIYIVLHVCGRVIRSIICASLLSVKENLTIVRPSTGKGDSLAYPRSYIESIKWQTQ